MTAEVKVLVKVTEYQEQGNSCFEIITVFREGDSGKQSPDACRVIGCISTSVRDKWNKWIKHRFCP